MAESTKDVARKEMIEYIEEKGIHYATAKNGVRFIYLQGSVWIVYPLMIRDPRYMAKPLPPTEENQFGRVRMFLGVDSDLIGGGDIDEEKRQEAITAHIAFLRDELQAVNNLRLSKVT